jgi:hypothetical protein
MPKGVMEEDSKVEVVEKVVVLREFQRLGHR